MDIQQLLQGLAERVAGGASVKMVYGEPIVAGNRTVIPAARVWYGFGAGGGRGKGEEGAAHSGGGGGGGGRVCASPCGVVEITPEGTRYIPFHNWRRMGAALALGFALGAAFAAARGPRHIEIVKRGR